MTNNENNLSSDSPKVEGEQGLSAQEEYQRMQEVYHQVAASDANGQVIVQEGSNKNRLILGVISAFVIIVVVALGIGAYWFYAMTLPVEKKGLGKDIQVKISSGSASPQIANELHKVGLIKNQFVFVQYGKYTGLSAKYKAGDYLLNPAMSLKEIMEQLAKGTVITQSFTIPEGYNLKQIAQVLGTKGYDAKRFLTLAKSGDNFGLTELNKVSSNKTGLEGYLFPDTYRVGKETSEEEIIKMMLKEFVAKIGPDYENKAAAQGLSLHQAVTLASIIEREAAKDSERPKVAAVFLNRLRQGIKLESCATIQYALGKVKPRLLYKDLKIDSPYNTYKNMGLPPGPIAAPSYASLMAVVNPAPVDYLFFVVSTDGKHIFSKTLKEHNVAKKQYISRFQVN